MPENDSHSGMAASSVAQSSKQSSDSLHPMTNDDFRKLLMTPRAAASSASSSSGALPSSQAKSRDDKVSQTPDVGDRRKKKKSFYATLKKAEEDKMAELARRYRDRAQERREGANPDYQNDDPISNMAGYRAVAPDAKSGLDAAERRRQMIQESKFLGGDMEHTHLVKGLDYALLQKVRSEITNKEQEDEELEEIVNVKKSQKEEEEEQAEFKTRLGRSIYRTVFRSHPHERNELFLPGRLAYVIDLEDEFAESDIPTTLIRSKADCPSFESQTTLTTNDIVINKLTQILSYLRQGTRSNKKMKKKDKGKLKDDERIPKATEESIFGDIGDYAPMAPAKSTSSNNDYDKERKDKDKSKRNAYFEKPSNEDDHRDGSWDKDAASHPASSRWITDANDGDKEARVAAITALAQEATAGILAAKREETKLRHAKILSRLTEPDGYAECYPGAPETADAIDDSDDEVDYTKMDMGNKKGPVGRWDFDTQEEYSDYMNRKEALPKAAFQYGVKMADGRKTRRAFGKKDEKSELDREWQKISKIISKRMATGGDGGEPEYKIPRY